MRRKQKPMKITQMDTLRSVRKKLPRPTVRQESSNKIRRNFTTKKALEDYYEDYEDEY